MDLGTVMLVIGGGIGLVLAGFGTRMLSSGRAPAPTARSFRTVRDAGRYHLLFGVALLLVALGARLPGRLSAAGATVLAIALVGFAVARYRPRGRRTGGEER